MCAPVYLVLSPWDHTKHINTGQSSGTSPETLPLPYCPHTPATGAAAAVPCREGSFSCVYSVFNGSDMVVQALKVFKDAASTIDCEGTATESRLQEEEEELHDMHDTEILAMQIGQGHPHVVQIVHAGYADSEHPAILMESCTTSVEQLLKVAGALAEPQAKLAIAQVGRRGGVASLRWCARCRVWV